MGWRERFTGGTPVLLSALPGGRIDSALPAGRGEFGLVRGGGVGKMAGLC